jgi:endonuclease/exonuclease/phosphatase family metal-dependent hydrolase
MAGSSIRLMTYNVHRWGDDRGAVAAVITSCTPDVVMIQEAPTWWGTHRRRLAMAHTVGLHYIVGQARTIALVADPDRWTVHRRRIWRPMIRRRKRFISLQLPGGAVAVSTRIYDSTRTLTVIGCHLGLAGTARVRELQQVLQLQNGIASSVIAGDVNEDSGGPVSQLAAAVGLVDVGAAADVPTFPAAHPHRRIDEVLASPHLTVSPVDLAELGLTHEVLVRASDHIPVVVDISLDSEREAA